jgi:hypothetical protein
VRRPAVGITTAMKEESASTGSIGSQGFEDSESMHATVATRDAANMVADFTNTRIDFEDCLPLVRVLRGAPTPEESLGKFLDLLEFSGNQCGVHGEIGVWGLDHDTMPALEIG